MPPIDDQSLAIARLMSPISANYPAFASRATSPQLRLDAVCFAAYQLKRTVALTLEGQHFARELPSAHGRECI